MILFARDHKTFDQAFLIPFARDHKTFDQAFLIPRISETIYMKQPEGFVI